MKSLTVAIPAYNRPELLRKALMKAIEASHGYNVSFLVCDDSPDRVNEKIVRDLSNKEVTIRYVGNDKCLGIDGNIKNCFDLSTSDYVWVVGEDDHVEAGAIKDIFDLVSNENLDVVFLNYVYCSNDYANDLSGRLLDVENLQSRLGVLKQYYKFGFIGSIAISKRCWNLYSKDAPLGTFFHHLSVMGKILFSSQEMRAGAIGDVCIRNRAENADSFSWSEQALAVHFGYYEAIRHFEGCLTKVESKELESSSKALFRPSSPLWLLSKRADGVYDLKDWAFWFRDAQLLKKMLFLAVAVVPQGLAKIAKKAYFRVKPRTI